MSHKTRTADYAWTVLARVLSVAKDRGKIAINVCEREGSLEAIGQTEFLVCRKHQDILFGGIRVASRVANGALDGPKAGRSIAAAMAHSFGCGRVRAASR